MNRLKSLSLVVTGRDDDYGKRFFPRVIKAMRMNKKLLDGFGIKTEWIFVDWAGESKRPLACQIMEEMPWWSKCYIAGPDWQDLFKSNKYLSFMEFSAKNIGIRRASEKFILATNSDVYLSPEIVEAMSRIDLSEEVIYRALRIDMRYDIELDEIAYSTLKELDKYTITNHAFPPLYTNASGDFTLASKRVWEIMEGYNEWMNWTKIHKDSNFLACAKQRYELHVKLLGIVYHLEHGTSYNMSKGKYSEPEKAAWGPNWTWQTPYQNGDSWGLALASEKEINAGIFLLSNPDGDYPKVYCK